ncbi:hypothetical protein EG329_013494 [Mollisiaceae sp. DMI_Dod_QoI]|nr:hypothetical protein EG329_013494 [Helotiales sp. DMI_Dod_QoI]
MLTCFEKLEKEKTALILCITVVHTQALQSIGNGVDILVERDMSKGAERVKKVEEKSKKAQVKMDKVSETTLPSERQIMKMPKLNSGMPRCPPIDDPRFKTSGLHQPEYGGHNFVNQFSDKRAIQLNGDFKSGRISSNTYAKSTSQGQSTQINGNIGSPGNHQHKDGIARGDSLQINGNVGEYVKKAEFDEFMGRLA